MFVVISRIDPNGVVLHLHMADGVRLDFVGPHRVGRELVVVNAIVREIRIRHGVGGELAGADRVRADLRSADRVGPDLRGVNRVVRELRLRHGVVGEPDGAELAGRDLARRKVRDVRVVQRQRRDDIRYALILLDREGERRAAGRGGERDDLPVRVPVPPPPTRTTRTRARPRRCFP